MFVMTDDGGPVQDDMNLQAARTLTQRTFIYELLANGIAVALMRGVEFKDAKVDIPQRCLYCLLADRGTRSSPSSMSKDASLIFAAGLIARYGELGIARSPI